MLNASRVQSLDQAPVPGFASPTVLVLWCELGPEFIANFPCAQHFGIWPGLCPDNRITGGKIYRVRTRDVKSRVAEALRLAAQSLWQAKNYFGGIIPKMAGSTCRQSREAAFLRMPSRVPFTGSTVSSANKPHGT